MKIMTISQLRTFLQSREQNFNFSAETNDDSIVVVVPAQLQFSENSDDSTEGLLPVSLLACHDKDNLNGSEISKSSMKKALKSFSNRPILAYIIEDEDGNKQFSNHRMHLSQDGSKIIYDEQPVGHTVGTAKLVYDPDVDKNRVAINGLLYEEYNDAADILRREEKCDVSVELAIREMSYDAKTKKLKLDAFRCNGITILGYLEDGTKVNPAMPGSNITIGDFSTTTDMKGDNNMNKFEELLAKYNKTAEDIDFDHSSLSDEELEAKFAEMFGENSTDGDDSVTDDNVVMDAEPANDEPTNDDVEPTTGAEEFSDNNAPKPEESDNYTATYSIDDKTFEVSLNDIQNAISLLVNNQYAEADGDFYACDIYQDSKTIVMRGVYSGKAYRQSYKVRNNEYSLTGDRVEVFAQYLTQDEIAAVDDLRSKYSVAAEKLAKYEAEPKKLEILNSADYSAIADSAEFEALKKNHFDMSVEDVMNKANEILLNYAKKNSAKFEKKPETKVRPFPEKPKYSRKKGRYADLFKKD